MPFTFKLANRLARIRCGAVLVVAVVGFACGGDDPVSPIALSSSNNPVAIVEVAPSDLTSTVGGHSQFTAIVRDGAGRVITGRPVQWKSNDTLVARISVSGTGWALGAGSATITATVDGRSGTARSTVQALPDGFDLPGTVSDLVVSAATETSLSIQFTEVADGTGLPATYLFRYALSPMNWGAPSAAVRGTCASVMAGESIGARRSCTLTGLAKGAAYDFQVRAFRMSLGRDSVFGGLSNVARGVSGQAGMLAASVVVTPGSSRRLVGESIQYTAVVLDAAGKEIIGKPVSWSSSNTAVATVNAAGMVTATGAGWALISATADARLGASELTVGGSGSATWPGEPDDFSGMVDLPFDGLTTLDWQISGNPNGLLSLGNDPEAPHSPSGILEFRFPAGYTGGGAPATAYYTHRPEKEVYAGFFWKPSSPWQNHPSNVNKLAFWQTGTWGSSLDLQMFGPPPYQLHVVTQFPDGTARLSPNVETTAIELGVWHRVEWHIKYATTPVSADGIVEWWLDGTLQGRYTNVQTPDDAGFSEFQLSPTWGGLDGTKTEDDFFLYDHLRISRR